MNKRKKGWGVAHGLQEILRELGVDARKDEEGHKDYHHDNYQHAYYRVKDSNSQGIITRAFRLGT